MKHVVFMGVIQVIPDLQWQSGSDSIAKLRNVLAPLPDHRLQPKTNLTPVLRSYDPFEEQSALFLTFAELPRQQHQEDAECPLYDSDRIREFARQYGRAAIELGQWSQRINEMWTRITMWKGGGAEPFAIENQSVSIYCNGDSGDYQLQVVTDDLWTVLRLQFNLAVANRWEFRECARCGDRFAIVPPDRRSTRMYCSDACSAAAYRERRKVRQQTEVNKRVKTTTGTRGRRSTKDK